MMECTNDMWNLLIRKGAVWTTKSINQYDEYYEGMTGGNKLVLILSAFMDYNNKRMFTYVKLDNRTNKEGLLDDGLKINLINYDNQTYNIKFDTLLTGEQLALEKHCCDLSNDDMNLITDFIIDHYHLHKVKKLPSLEYKEQKSSMQQHKIHKFGIDVYITENSEVKISEKGKLLLSDKAKDDIIYNSKTEEDLRKLSDKYLIFPIKAIREIRNRLIYQHKQKNG